MEGEYGIAVQALIAVIITSTSGLLGPMIIGNTVDIVHPESGLSRSVHVRAGAAWRVSVRAVLQLLSDSANGQLSDGSVLFNLRNALFTKLQALPVAFFNQNKAGDLISRINNDTDKLNQFFSQALVQFAGNLS